MKKEASENMQNWHLTTAVIQVEQEYKRVSI